MDPNALSRALAEARHHGREILDLTVSNPTVCGFEYPEALIRTALGGPEVLRYAPDPLGSLVAREAISTWHGHGVSPEDLILSASTSEAYAWLFKLLCDPGDDVLAPSPSYPLFEWLARLEGIRARSVPCHFHERWHLDLEALESACGSGTRAIIAVNPNNPSGHFLSRTEWDGLLDLGARKGLALIVDEVFVNYSLEVPEDRLPSALEMEDPPCPVFILSGFSKIAALPQVKLGWIIARSAPARQMLDHLAFIADQYLSVSASAQAAASLILTQAPMMQEQIRNRLRDNLRMLDTQLASHPHLSRLPVEGGWSVILRRPAVDSDEECALRLLKEAAVLVHPGHFFDMASEGHLVLSLITPTETLDQGLRLGIPLM
jgi:hypothetical protein